ncbi:hypothetical protein HY546_03050 [archaeon]|nr:hypothetical protein [archaeon]
MMNEIDLSKPAKVLIGLLRVKVGDRFLIICDKETQAVAEAIYGEACRATDRALLLKCCVDDESIYKLAAQCDIILAAVSGDYDLSQLRPKAGARGAEMSGITKEIFGRAVDVDYQEIRKTGTKLYKCIREASKLRVESESGTKLFAYPGKVFLDCGEFSLENGFENLPTGEAYLIPRDVAGVFHVDEGGGECENGSDVVIRGSRVQEVVGDKPFFKRLCNARNARIACELGFGLNPKATVSPNIIEAEKLRGAVHIGLGSNRHFFPYGARSGFIDSPVHIDLLALNVSVWADDVKILEGGEYLL